VNKQRKREGFTLPEILVSTAISALVLAAVLVVTIFASRYARSGSYQIHFTGKGRTVSQKITRVVEQANAVGVSSNGIDLLLVDATLSRIYFDDGDGDTASVSDNRLMYLPDTSTTGDVRVLCDYVSSLPGEPMFAVQASNSVAAIFRLHIGDGTNMLSDDFLKTGVGYQGVELRFSAAPRNRQLWYN
jgi:prepilin-type N-terminal cleavage/methylation domain-containing protein